MEQAITIDQVGGPFGESAMLTTETNMSSYGIPVLLWRGEQLSCVEAEARGIYPYALMPEPTADSAEGAAAITAWIRGVAYTDELIAEEAARIARRDAARLHCQICGERCNGDGYEGGDAPCGADHGYDGATEDREYQSHQIEANRTIRGRHYDGYICGACCVLD